MNHLFSRSNYLDLMERFHFRWTAFADETALRESIRDVLHNLRVYGIDFEGNEIPVSLVPTIVPSGEVSGIAAGAVTIRDLLQRVLRAFCEAHTSGNLDSLYHKFFTPYYRWWDIIASERRRLAPIQLMRYDAIRSHDGRWSFLETNTCCPGGTIHCARIRNAWLMTKLGNKLTRGVSLDEHEIDQPDGFVKFLARLAEELDPACPNIAILNHKSVYSNEFSSLEKCFNDLKARGILAGELILGDIRDVDCRQGRAYLRGTPLSLIYNKLDPLSIDPRDPAIQGWLAVSQCEHTDFLNSLGAMYLAEAKRVLALLCDPELVQHLHMDDRETQTLGELIPPTRVVGDLVRRSLPHPPMMLTEKGMFVLKADALTRGSGVMIGDQVTDAAWTMAVNDSLRSHSVVQMRCNPPTRIGIQIDAGSNVKSVTEFYGVDVFLFGGSFAGLVSRSHTNQVFNVGNGGRESPVLIVRE